MVCPVSISLATPAKAMPPLPSSFYGELKVNGQNLPDGSSVRALIDAQVYAEGYTETYQGASVYVLDVPGDDSSTTVIEGGREGDTIQFEVAGVLAAETGVWHSGTNTRLDLTASAGEILIITQATPSPLPTQTPIVFAHTSSIDPALISVQSVPANTSSAQPTFTATAADEVLPPTGADSLSQQAAVLVQPSPIFDSTRVPIRSQNAAESSSIHFTFTVTLSTMILIIGGTFWLIRKKFFIITKSRTSKQNKTKGGL